MTDKYILRLSCGGNYSNFIVCTLNRLTKELILKFRIYFWKNSDCPYHFATLTMKFRFFTHPKIRIAFHKFKFGFSLIVQFCNSVIYFFSNFDLKWKVFVLKAIFIYLIASFFFWCPILEHAPHFSTLDFWSHFTFN